MQSGHTLLESARAVRRVLFDSTMGRVGLLAMAGFVVASGMSEKRSVAVSPTANAEFNARFEIDRPVPPAERVAAAPPSVAPQPAVTIPQEQKPDLAPEPDAMPGPMRQADLLAEPAPGEFPKSVTVQLPIPRPPLSPAQRLHLQGNEYARAERCLAQAVYFEARNEGARGQQAVAQVVLNRVFSPYYPKDICSVVYQNAHRHLSCQFTFACDGKAERVSERGAWARANRIAQQMLNAWVWLPEVNKATHYHAAYVRPNWIRDMKVMVRYGLHIFYRPRNWATAPTKRIGARRGIR